MRFCKINRYVPSIFLVLMTETAQKNASMHFCCMEDAINWLCE